MCGRFTIAKDYQTVKAFLKEKFQLDLAQSFYALPRYNIAPSQLLLTVIHDGKNYRVGPLKWGFLPAFAKDYSMAYKMINARSETVHEKTSFMPSLKHQRCLIIADGYYEWDKHNNPYYFHQKEHNLFVFAGLYTKNEVIEKSPLFTTTILTQEADNSLYDIHHRMPVILDEEDIRIWLNPNTSFNDLLRLFTSDQLIKNLTFYPVSKTVNQASIDSIDCIKPKE